MAAPGVGKKRRTKKQKLAQQAQTKLINQLINEVKKKIISNETY